MRIINFILWAILALMLACFCVAAFPVYLYYKFTGQEPPVPDYDKLWEALDKD